MQALVETSPGVWESRPIRAHASGLFFVDPENLPKDSESRIAYINNTAPGFFAVIGAAQPTLPDGSAFIKYENFTNSPKMVSALSTLFANADGTNEHTILGWACVVNAASDAAAATTLNAALSSPNVARYRDNAGAGAPIQSNVDTSGLFIVPARTSELFRYRQDAVISTIHVAPVSVSATPINNNFIAQFTVSP